MIRLDGGVSSRFEKTSNRFNGLYGAGFAAEKVGNIKEAVFW